jgi:hypothetical protein
VVRVVPVSFKPRIVSRESREGEGGIGTRRLIHGTVDTYLTDKQLVGWIRDIPWIQLIYRIWTGVPTDTVDTPSPIMYGLCKIQHYFTLVYMISTLFIRQAPWSIPLSWLTYCAGRWPKLVSRERMIGSGLRLLELLDAELELRVTTSSDSVVGISLSLWLLQEDSESDDEARKESPRIKPTPIPTPKIVIAAFIMITVNCWDSWWRLLQYLYSGNE